MANQTIDLVFNALGDPTRRSIIENLSLGPKSIKEIAEPLEISVTAILQHLQVLEACGLARSEKVGRQRIANIDMHGFAVAERWLRDRQSMWEKRYSKLRQILE
jgi:DNA-binding transcriptional ArsR family regulator